MSQDYRQKCLAQKINACNVCGTGEELLVHHANGDRNDNRLENLVPLCDSCHKRVHRSVNPEGPIRELQSQLPENNGQRDPDGVLISAKVDSSFKHNFRVAAAKRDMSMSELIQEAIEEKLGGDNP